MIQNLVWKGNILSSLPPWKTPQSTEKIQDMNLAYRDSKTLGEYLIKITNISRTSLELDSMAAQNIKVMTSL